MHSIGWKLFNSLKLTPHNQKQIKSILNEFAKIVIKNQNQVSKCGLYRGLAGDLLFLFKYSEYFRCPFEEQLFNEKFDFLQEQLANYVAYPEISRGLSGQAWFIEFINQAREQDYDSEACEEIDHILEELIGSDTWPGEIETVLGLSGIAAYAGRRYRASGESRLLELIVSNFEKLAIKTSCNTLSWPQPINSTYRMNENVEEVHEFNLGLAHGVPGIISALLFALNIEHLSERVKKMLVYSCNWLIEQAEYGHSKSCFGNYCTGKYREGVIEYGRGSEQSRLGWCYGDLTIALTLARVGNSLNVPYYLEKAKKIGMFASLRTAENASIADAGICHGSAGLALIFQLLSKEIKEQTFEKAAGKWLAHTLNLYEKKGIEGMFRYSPEDQSYHHDTSFLMGFSGIGLCLLSALGCEPDWADCLLMSHG